MKSLAQAAQGFVRAAGVSNGRKLELVRGFFRAAAGALNGKLLPESFIGGELVLVSASERWLDAGNRGSEALRQRLNRFLGEEAVRRIVVKPGKYGIPKRAPRAKGAKIQRETEVAEEIMAAAEGIEDERLRRAFIGLAARVAAVGKPEARSG